MYLMARIDTQTGVETEWFVAFTPDVEQVQVTRTRKNARRFKRESDAMSVRNMAANIAPEYQWKVVAA